MLLAKVMNDQAGDVAVLAAGKTYLKYLGPGVEALLAVAKAYHFFFLKIQNFAKLET